MKKHIHDIYGLRNFKRLKPVILITLLLASCSQFINIQEPVDRITSDKIFDNESTATAAVLGIYSKMLILSPTITSGATTVYAGLCADELYPTGLSYHNYFNNEILPAATENDFWRFAYEYIYQANSCIEGLDNSSININIKQQLKGEVHFIRAFCYWYLVNLFGDVPLILSTDYEENARIGRTSYFLVVQQIITDLELARELLNEEYVGNDRERVNRQTAAAFLARVHLYQENWSTAVQYADEVINSSFYEIEENLNDVFLISSNEVIWRLIERTYLFEHTREATFFIPGPSPTNLPSCAITESLLGSFETTDNRLSSWTGEKTVRGVLYSFPYKYKIRFGGNGLTEGLVMFRLAELYLIRAEAKAHLNDFSGSLKDLNVVRKRAGLSNLESSSQEEILIRIAHERQIELFAEWGHRWFDLKRTNKIDPVLSETKPRWKSTAALWPIPYNQILLNPNLTQNPGYE